MAARTKPSAQIFQSYTRDSDLWAFPRNAFGVVIGDEYSIDADVAADVFSILQSFQLQLVRRYFNQRYWEAESTAAAFSDKAEEGLKLENVAAHSWHVADMALLFAGRFAELNLERCLALAILHDKLEMFTGDFDPVGRGTGSNTHAFSSLAAAKKEGAERQAAAVYLSSLRLGARSRQEELIAEIIEGKSAEARFIKAVDKMQALAFVLVKKAGNLSDKHLLFTLRYSAKAKKYYPSLDQHYELLCELLLNSVSSARGWSRARLEGELFGQLELDL